MPSLLSSAAALLLLSMTVTADTMDCKHIRVDGQSFHLEKLGGPKTVHQLQSNPPNIHNTSFTIDICAPLEIDDKVPKNERCMHGTRICAKDWEYREGQEPFLSRVIPIAGDYATRTGRVLDPKYTRLNGSESHADAGLEGVRAELHGGMYDGQKQRAIIEFICDSEMEGTEGFEDGKDEMLGRRAEGEGEGEGEGDGDGDDEGPELPKPDEGKALQFISYKTERDDSEKTLRLSWKTKYACEKQAEKDPENDGGESKSSGWGFFTWFLIIVFLLAAAYIIFGSWLNYNRYGARGWDLVPHGDTIRDLPYIIKDWFGSLTERFSGGGTRGGYSAV